MENQGEKTELELQSALRQLLFVRPFDINKIESAAVVLCDAVVDNAWNTVQDAASSEMVKKSEVQKLAKNLLIKSPTNIGQSYNKGIGDLLNEISKLKQ